MNEEWLRDGTGEMFAPDASDELEALVKRYDLSNADQVLIEKYINLKAGSRETIIDFITDVVAALEDLDPNAKAFPSGSVSELDIDAEVEAYRQQLELQKKRRQNRLSPVVETTKGQVKRRRSRGILQQNFLAASRSRTCGSNREAAG